VPIYILRRAGPPDSTGLVSAAHTPRLV